MDRLMPGVIAVLVGAVALTLVFVPLVALSYRRRGGFSAARMLGWIALLFYVMGLWAYTLLPLPDGAYDCVGVELDPFAVVTDIARLQAEEGGSLLRNAAFQQLVLNIVLFAPLGFFVRALFDRGVVVATAAGALVSLGIELTQLTGIWGAYPCAYRLFDTGDLLANTIGAVLGSLAALALLRRGRASDEPRDASPSAVSAGRRLLAMTADLLVLGVGSVVLSVLANTAILLLAGREAVLEVADPVSLAATLLVIAAQAVSVLAGGVTLGERAVLIGAVEPRRPRVLWRLVRFAVGIGGYGLLQLAPEPWSLLASALAVASLVVAFTSRGHRGLGQAAAGMDAIACAPGQGARTPGQRRTPARS
ncbi:VanZ family protein [Agromyces sp. NPDC058064]|uniref:VanZ family protein n=1 Tax=Agromyces sp. NPDC058064 TaxID=3346322 RepID=UPI0036DA9C60